MDASGVMKYIIIFSMGGGVKIIYKVLLSLNFIIAKFIWEGFVVMIDFITECYFLNLYIT